MNLSLNSFGQIIATFAGNGTGGYSGDGGQAAAAGLVSPAAVVFDSMGNLYIADQTNNRIRMVNASGIITTIAGNGTSGFSGDNGPATAAQLSSPSGLTMDALGNLYIADQSNNRIRKINTAGIITTVVGIGTHGYSGDGGQATNAQLYDPTGLVFDASGNLYIADFANNVIRKVDTAGIISTFAGNGYEAGMGSGGFSGDGGQATAAELSEPYALAVDAIGNLYFTDGFRRIRKINTAGVISTIAGNGTASYAGDGGPATAAELNSPGGLIFDSAGNLYISDASNNRVRKINTAGIITTIAGNGVLGYSGDGGLAVSAKLNSPGGITMDASGNLYFTDWGNHVIRNVTNPSATSVYSIQYSTITPVAGDVDSYTLAGGNITLGGTVTNWGSSSISTFSVAYTDGTSTWNDVKTGLNIASFATYSFNITMPYNTPLGSNNIKAWVTLNGDINHSDDTLNTVLVGVAYMPTHQVVLEESTGTWCEWCPRGAVYMDSMAVTYPTGVSLIAIHGIDPMEVPVYNNGFNPISGGAFPTIAFDRKETLDPLFTFQRYADHAADFGFADLTLATTVTGNNLVASATVKPAVNLSGTYQLALVITENNVHDTTDTYYIQNDAYSGGAYGIMRDGTTHIDFDLTWPGNQVPATKMIYNDVARSISGSFNGDAGSLPASMTAGTTYTYSFASQSISAWNLSELRAILLLIDATSSHATNGQILNSVSTGIGLTTEITKKNNIIPVNVFPNPTSGMLHIEALMQNDNISIYDVLGNAVIVTKEKQIDVSGLANGIYFIKTNQGISKFIKQ